MSTTQPIWKFAMQLGDVHPIEYGGYFIYEDETGVYPPEGEILIEPEYNKDEEKQVWEVRRFILDRCTFIDGILSDNKFHPESEAWFADSLDKIAEHIGATKEELIANFCSENLQDRAMAWRTIGEYHGWDNLDAYPLTLNSDEVQKRYAKNN